MRIAVARGGGPSGVTPGRGAGHRTMTVAVPVTVTVTVTVADECGMGRQWGGRHDGGPIATC